MSKKYTSRFLENNEKPPLREDNAKPYAILSSSTSSKVMLFFASNSIKLVEFVSSEDALARDLLSLKELLSRYYGDKDLLQSLIENGQKQN